jgi:predicted mannosyl-3-phosphoglycerate phosphatase (HAD superfamily)
MGREAMRLMVVSDLDGTLLDHSDYSFDLVLPVLDRMDEAGILLWSIPVKQERSG